MKEKKFVTISGIRVEAGSGGLFFDPIYDRVKKLGRSKKARGQGGSLIQQRPLKPLQLDPSLYPCPNDGYQKATFTSADEEALKLKRAELWASDKDHVRQTIRNNPPRDPTPLETRKAILDERQARRRRLGHE